MKNLNHLKTRYSARKIEKCYLDVKGFKLQDFIAKKAIEWKFISGNLTKLSNRKECNSSSKMKIVILIQLRYIKGRHWSF